MQFAEANEEVVKEVTRHMMAAFEEFIRTHPDGYVSFVDALMVAHNVHIHMLRDIEANKGLDHEGKLFLRRMAVDTFKLYLERKP